MRSTSLVALVAALAVGGCGGGERQGVAVTEAEPVRTVVPPGPRPVPRPVPLDTVYADSGLYADPALDSLEVAPADDDSSSTTVPAAPDFRTFWPAFQRAVREGEAAVAARTAVGEGGVPRERFARLYPRAFGEPFREGILALTARDFRIRGAARDVSVTVGYDAEGAVVPEDEAVTEASVRLRFEPRDGAYRLVGLEIVE